MISLAAELDLAPLRDSMRALRRELNDELERAIRTTSREVSREAKRSHTYQNRTGRLTRSIGPLPTVGRFTADTLEGGVTATMRYASYVDEGTARARAYQYLGTAWLMQREDSERRVEDALEAAVAKAGLG